MRTCVRACVRAYARTYIRTYARTYVHVLTYVRTYVRTYVHTYVCTYVRSGIDVDTSTHRRSSITASTPRDLDLSDLANTENDPSEHNSTLSYYGVRPSVWCFFVCIDGCQKIFRKILSKLLFCKRENSSKRENPSRRENSSSRGF